MKTLKKVGNVIGMSILFACGIALLLQSAADQLIQRLENVTYDWRYRLKYQGTADAEFPDYGIHIVDIDERSMEKMGSYWSWNRGYQAKLVDSLSTRFPAAIVFDVLFFNREDSIRYRQLAETLNDAIRGDSVLAERSYELNVLLESAVDYDEQFERAIARSGRVTLGMAMADTIGYRGYTSQIEHRMDMDWHNSLNPASTITFHDSLLQRVMLSKDVIDGIYPENARAARDIGHVNAVDATGIVRQIPLLYRFANFPPVYLPVSVRAAATLFGTPSDEIAFVPEKYIDIGKPFKVFKDADGTARFSYPDFTEVQLSIILNARGEILSYDGNRRKDVSSYTVFYRDEEGRICLETRAYRLSHELTVALLRGDDPLRLDKMGTDDEVDIGNNFTVRRDSDIEWEIFSDGEAYWLTASEIKTLAAITDYMARNDIDITDSNTGGKSLLRDDERRKLITSDFWVRREPGRGKNSGALVSSIPVLRAETLEELLSANADFIESMPPNTRRDFGSPARIPLGKRNQHIVTYFGPNSKPFPYFSFYDVMNNNVNVPMEGRIFIVGSTSPAMFDIISTPHEQIFPAVELHASIMNSILTNTYVRRLTDRQNLIILILAGLAAALLAFLTKPFLGGLLLGGLLFVYALVSFHVFNTSQTWIEMLRPMIAIALVFTAVVIYRYITEEKNRKYLQSTFKQYLSPELIDLMYTQKQKPKLGGDEGELTAFFTDIAGFSSFSEKLTPNRLVELLNEYLTAMTDILLANRGTLDKYIGDAIVAFFGAPVSIPNHASIACRTALAMQEKLAELRVKWHSEGDKWPQEVYNMKMRIGINSGNITTGNMGSTMRMNYTMMGDPVNVASRLESAAKQYGVYTMISHFTYNMITADTEARRGVNEDIARLSGQTLNNAQIPAAGKDEFETRMLDIVIVKGKTEPITIYELLGFKDKMTEEMYVMLDIYNQGVSHYYRREWEKALEFFERSDKLEPNRKAVNGAEVITPSSKFAKKCRAFIENPPPGNWNGVNQLSEK